jgi:hypothetical protein
LIIEKDEDKPEKQDRWTKRVLKTVNTHKNQSQATSNITSTKACQINSEKSKDAHFSYN